MTLEEEVAVLKQRVQAQEEVMKKILQLVNDQNSVIKKMAEALTAILNKLAVENGRE